MGFSLINHPFWGNRIYGNPISSRGKLAAGCQVPLLRFRHREMLAAKLCKLHEGWCSSHDSDPLRGKITAEDMIC